MRIGSYLRAARPMAFPMIALPLLWGQAIAWGTLRQFEWMRFAELLLFGVMIQAYVLYLNDAADEAVDRQNNSFWMSGGSRVIPDGQLSAAQLLAAARIFAVLMVLASLGLAASDRPWLPGLVVMALIAGWTYSLKPLQSSYAGYGELHQAISCGVLLPVIAFYLQAGTLAEFYWPLVIPLAMIFFAGNIVTALPDVVSDKAGHKLTYPVRRGTSRARRDAVLVLLIAYCLALLLNPLPDLNMALFLACVAPASLVIVLMLFMGLVSNAELAGEKRMRQFVGLASSSQAWMLATWCGTLFLCAADSSGH